MAIGRSARANCTDSHGSRVHRRARIGHARIGHACIAPRIGDHHRRVGTCIRDETARIGNHVKLYQGVTLGAKSFETDDSGHPVKGTKRHPDIGDRVTIYAHASILGGDTQIGANSVIGSNVWIMKSVTAGSAVYFKSDQLVVRPRRTKAGSPDLGTDEMASWDI